MGKLRDPLLNFDMSKITYNEMRTYIQYYVEFVQKLIEKETETNSSRIDKEFLEQASTQLKQAIYSEKKVKWTLDLISQLREAQIGDTEKLDRIDMLLRSGKSVEEDDKQYLKAK